MPDKKKKVSNAKKKATIKRTNKMASASAKKVLGSGAAGNAAKKLKDNRSAKQKRLDQITSQMN